MLIFLLALFLLFTWVFLKGFFKIILPILIGLLLLKVIFEATIFLYVLAGFLPILIAGVFLLWVVVKTRRPGL